MSQFFDAVLGKSVVDTIDMRAPRQQLSPISLSLLLAGLSFIGDSRAADLTINPRGKQARSWFPWSSLYYKAAPAVVGSYGVSGQRTDEYLSGGAVEKAIADASAIVVFSYPIVNDVSQALAGYTDKKGRRIDLSNVVDCALDNLTSAIQKITSAGKRALCFAETGSTSLTAAQVTAVHLFNQKYKEALATLPGKPIFYNPCPLVWDASASATLIAFKANYSTDGTHPAQLWSKAVGKDVAAKVYPLLFPAVDTAVSSASDIVANGTSQLFSNPLFTATSGGTTGGNITVSSGTVPAGVAVSGSAAGLLTVAISSAPNADGFGNDITFDFTATGPVQARIDFAVASAGFWNLTDSFQAGVEVDLAGGTSPTPVNIWTDLQVNYNTAPGQNVTLDCYDCYAEYVNSGNQRGAPALVAPESGLVFRSMKVSIPDPAYSKGYINNRLLTQFLAAGTARVTVRRAQIFRFGN